MQESKQEVTKVVSLVTVLETAKGIQQSPLCLAFLKRGIGKQRRPGSETTERGIWPGSTLFALNTDISLNHGNNKKKLTTHPFYWKRTGPKS